MLFSPFHELVNLSKCRFCDFKFSQFKDLIKHEASHYKFPPTPPEEPPKIEIKIEKVEPADEETDESVPVDHQNQILEQNDFSGSDEDFDFDDVDDDDDIDLKFEDMDFDFDEILTNLLEAIKQKDSSRTRTTTRRKGKRHKNVKNHHIRLKGEGKRADVLAVIKRVNNYDYTKDAVAFIEKLNGKQRTMYKCKYCSKAIQSKYNLFHHMMVHNGEKPYGCKYCSFSSNQTINRDRHEEICPKNTTNNSSSNKLQLVIKSSKLISKKLKSSCKPSKVVVKKKLKMKVQSKTKKTCNTTIEAFKEPKIVKIVKKPKIIKEISKSKTVKISKKNDISKSNGGSVSYSLEMEDKILFEMKNFDWTRDFVKVGAGSKGAGIYKCNICQKNLLQHSRTQLYTHKLVHSGLKPFSCRYCPRRFVTPVYRDRHEVSSKHVDLKNPKEITTTIKT